MEEPKPPPPAAAENAPAQVTNPPPPAAAENAPALVTNPPPPAAAENAPAQVTNPPPPAAAENAPAQVTNPPPDTPQTVPAQVTDPLPDTTQTVPAQVTDPPPDTTQTVPAQVTDSPPDTTQTVPPQAPPPPSLPPKTTKKRPLDNNGQLQNSNYYKMRLVLKDLRPHFIEVDFLPITKNFRFCEELKLATTSINMHDPTYGLTVRGSVKKIKILMELYKAETVITVKGRAVAESQPPQDVKVAEQPQKDGVSAKSSEIESKKQQGKDAERQGSCIVGGSAFGWNFITFAGTQPVYYGVTKELFRKLNSGEGQ
ncbi:ran-binding protein 9-like [Pistacia vera]|uniref:ran-binding protein 9-like n=1 Tax=Pistacia vera TaxID=55513 RepID=UPI0012636AC0|nr:ran-binding protein 9-like [Pistacia vera]